MATPLLILNVSMQGHPAATHVVTTSTAAVVF